MYEYRLFEVMPGWISASASALPCVSASPPSTPPELRGGQRRSGAGSGGAGVHPRRGVRTFKASAASVAIGDAAYGRWRGEFADRRSGEVLADSLRAAGHEK